MNLKEIKDLIDVLKDTEVTELEIEKSGTRVKIKMGGGQDTRPVFLQGQIQQPAQQPQITQVQPEALPAPQASPEPEGKNYVVVSSPIVGTFYRSPSPEAANYVEVGDVVKKGQILCIIEAMKLMNEIEAEVSGKVVGVMVENAQPVEYGEPLFHIEPM